MGLVLGLCGNEIEELSMKIIEDELGETSFSKKELAIVKRVIHATADFDFAKNIRFHKDAIKRGIDALKSGRPIITDTKMAASGISWTLLKNGKSQIITPISFKECKSLAQEKRGTLSEAAMELAAKFSPGIIVIGNAPTALIKVIELIKRGILCPDVVIGVPVGFVNAKESKDELLKQDLVPYITTIGRKGGTPVAVAIVNALIRLMHSIDE